MGMDVYGKAPTSETGKYFRRNVWGWRPLWNYCEDNHHDIVAGVDGHSNSGDGLDADGAIALGKALLADVDSGAAQAYVDARNATIAQLPRAECTLCNGTGIRGDEVGMQHGMPIRTLDVTQQVVLGRIHGWCNGCDGMGDKENWEASYFLDLDDVAEFAEFLLDSGGFEIC